MSSLSTDGDSVIASLGWYAIRLTAKKSRALEKDESVWRQPEGNKKLSWVKQRNTVAV